MSNRSEMNYFNFAHKMITYSCFLGYSGDFLFFKTIFAGALRCTCETRAWEIIALVPALLREFREGIIINQSNHFFNTYMTIQS